MDETKKKILQAVIDEYINTAEPVSSSALVEKYELKYSSATVRNELAELENSVYKLAMEIKKTQKRANALDKIQIPKYESTIKYIEEVLEEKEREDFFRLKKVKDRKK